MSNSFALTDFSIESNLSAERSGYRQVYKVRSKHHGLSFKCYQFDFDVHVGTVSFSEIPLDDYISVFEMPVVHEMPDIGHGERAEIEVTSLLHALTILRTRTILQSFVHRFEDVWCRRTHTQIYILFPWLDGLALHQVTRTVSETAAERSVNAVLEMLAMFHQEGVCLHDVSIQQMRNGRLIPGNIWFVEVDDQLSCCLIDIETLMYFDAPDAEQKATYFQSPCFAPGYISQWNITPVDAVHDIFQRHRRGEVVYGWHVDIILALALLQDAECLSFQDYESRIDALKVASGRPTIAPNKYGQPPWEATPDLTDGGVGSAIAIPEFERVDPPPVMVELPEQTESDSMDVAPMTAKKQQKMLRYFVGFAVVGFLMTLWMGWENKPTLTDFSNHIPIFGNSESTLEPLYGAMNDKTRDSLYLSTLKRVQNQHEQNPRDVNAYAELLFLKIIAPNADECGVWYDAAKGRKYSSDYVKKAMQRPICQRLYQEVQGLIDRYPNHQRVQWMQAFWTSAECIALTDLYANNTVLSSTCMEANEITSRLLERPKKLPKWMFWELSRLHLTLHDVVEIPQQAIEQQTVCESVFNSYERQESSILRRRMLQSTKRCWGVGEFSKQLRWMQEVVSKDNFSVEGWHYQLGSGQCAGTGFQSSSNDWDATLPASYCSWLATSLGRKEVYPLPPRLILSNWCLLDVFDWLDGLGMTVCKQVPDQFQWLDTQKALQKFLPDKEST